MALCRYAKSYAMRVIAGSLRGRQFTLPRRFSSRPTTDFAKENLFNVLENLINFEEVKVLDLFSGTGSITYEFISRGCLDICAVEANYKHYSFIKKNLEEFGVKASLKMMDAFRFLDICTEKYDIIFADPPFDLERAKTLPKKIFELNVLKNGGIFILEHNDSHSFEKFPYFWQVRNYGGVNFTFFRKNNEHQYTR